MADKEKIWKIIKETYKHTFLATCEEEE